MRSLCFLLSATLLHSEQLIPAARLQEDVTLLRQAYETLHPGLYRYNTKKQIDGAFEDLLAAFNSDRTVAQAYLALSIFAAKIKCGHTYPNFFNQPKQNVSELFERSGRVPFYFRWIDGGMIVTRDFSVEGSFPSGTRVIAINGVPAKHILDRLLTVARADGSNDAKRISNLEVTGDSRYEAFDIYFPLFYPPPSSEWTFTIERPGQPKSIITTKPLTYAQRVAPIQQRESARDGGDSPQFQWEYIQGGAVHLRMPTWALYNSKWNWTEWLNERVDEAVARKAPALIVDLRGNEGGQDVGNLFLSRVISSDLQLLSERRFVRYREVPKELVPHLSTWDPSFKNWGAAAKDLGTPPPNLPRVPYFRLVRDSDEASGQLVRPEGKRYAGKLIVLIGAANSSATFQFAQAVQQNKLGTLIGQPTGGNRRGINGGAFFFLRLPNSTIELDVPLIATFPETNQPDAGLVPDVRVKIARSDIAAGRDAELAAALKQLDLK